jgi:hypothetical protein
MARAPKKKPKDVTLAPLHPNVGLEVEYRRKLVKLTEEMNKSVTYWLEAKYNQNTPIMAMDYSPEMALDDMPANILTTAIRRLSKRWLRAFDDAADDLAKYFSKAAYKRTDAQLARILKKGGFTVKFTMTPAMRDVLNATISENVALIKSIPQQYLKNVEVQVMQSVKAGRDLGTLAKGLEKNYGVTKRRAQLIARDQNNKATSAMNKARQLEIGVTTAVWVHSGGGKHPRPTHLKAGKDRVVYEVAKGWFDPAVNQWIQPGELINCKCVSRAMIKGFS